MTILYEMKSDHTALIILNRPDSLNAFNAELRADLRDAMMKASADAAVRAVVITGAGRGFSAGADVKDMDFSRSVEDVLNVEYGAFLSIVRTCEKTVIAAINGPAAGIGMTLALSCDLRVMAEEAYLLSAFSTIGLVPDGGLSWILTQQLGYSRAYQLAIEAEKIDAARALEWGLVNRAVATEKTLDVALEWAEAIAERAPIALALTKRAFRRAAEEGIANAAAYEAALQRTALASEDCREGAAALAMKRKPVFKGR